MNDIEFINNQINISLKDLINIYFTQDISDNSNYDDLFLLRITKLFKYNLINFLDEFIYNFSYNTFNEVYKNYFTNIHYKTLLPNRYKSILITDIIKDFYKLNNKKYIQDIFYSILKEKIKLKNDMDMVYDIYNIAYISIYKYFYEYLQAYIYLDNTKRKIYNKLTHLTNRLLDSFNDTHFIVDYFNIYLSTKYLLVQLYNKDIQSLDNNELSSYTTLQSYDSLKEAIEHLNQYIEFHYNVLPIDIYYNNLFYIKDKTITGIILTSQNFKQLF